MVAGTSCVTAGKIVDELLDQGVLEPAESKRESRPGRPGQALRLNTRAPRLVLVQLGVGNTRMAFAALGTSVDTPWSVEFETPGSAEEWEKGIAAGVGETDTAEGERRVGGLVVRAGDCR